MEHPSPEALTSSLNKQLLEITWVLAPSTHSCSHAVLRFDSEQVMPAPASMYPATSVRSRTAAAEVAWHTPLTPGTRPPSPSGVHGTRAPCAASAGSAALGFSKWHITPQNPNRKMWIKSCGTKYIPEQCTWQEESMTEFAMNKTYSFWLQAVY